MTQVSTFSLIFLTFTIGAQLWLRPKTEEAGHDGAFVKHLHWFIIAAVLGLAAILSYYTALQYFTWASGGTVSRFLLPPYQGIRYFLFYALTEFWAGYLLAAVIGVFGYLTIRRATRKRDTMFYPEEAGLSFLGTLLIGHPFWICYFLSLLACILTGTLRNRFTAKTNERVSFRYLWLPVAAAVVFLTPLLNKLDFFIYLKF